MIKLLGSLMTVIYRGAHGCTSESSQTPAGGHNYGYIIGKIFHSLIVDLHDNVPNNPV